MEFVRLRGLRIDAITGKFIARDFEDKGLCGFQHFQEDASSSWLIEHDRNINFFICAVFVNKGRELSMITPEKIEWLNSESILIEFFEPVTGFANILYYTNNHLDCPTLNQNLTE